jgi:hypothetical protein
MPVKAYRGFESHLFRQTPLILKNFSRFGSGVSTSGSGGSAPPARRRTSADDVPAASKSPFARSPRRGVGLATNVADRPGRSSDRPATFIQFTAAPEMIMTYGMKAS